MLKVQQWSGKCLHSSMPKKNLMLVGKWNAGASVLEFIFFFNIEISTIWPSFFIAMEKWFVLWHIKSCVLNKRSVLVLNVKWLEKINFFLAYCSKNAIRRYQTSFCFAWNLSTGMYFETYFDRSLSWHLKLLYFSEWLKVAL